MAAETADTRCQCGCVRACHRRAMEYGQVVYTTCRHCTCRRFAAGEPTTTAAEPTRPEPAAVLAAYAALACLTHGHNCTGAGPCELTPVTVTLTARARRS